MKFLWQQRVLLLVSAVLSATPSPAVAASFVMPTTAMKAAAFSNKNGRYNPLVHVSAGGDDSVNAAGNQEGGGESAADTPPAPEAPAAVATTIPEATSLLGPNAKSPSGFLRSKLPGMPWHKLPDYVTYARCIAIPVFVTFFYANMKGKSHLYTGTIFALASITDWLDGFLARRWDISTACKCYAK
jgi:hypothetical protein